VAWGPARFNTHCTKWTDRINQAESPNQQFVRSTRPEWHHKRKVTPNGHASAVKAEPQARLSHWRMGHPIHTARDMRIICIGAGASGLCFAYKLQRSFEKFSLTVYEKNAECSGTWFENTYPGYIELCLFMTCVD